MHRALSVAEMPITTTPRSRGIDRADALRALIGDQAVVYAIRLDDGVIKIGCTRNLTKRRGHFPGGEILGFTFGDEADELQIHHQLHGHVARGREYYHPTAAVLSLVNDRMRRPLGLPEL